jgi:pantetheine-phosphate adenylyltransferase
MIFPGSFDPFSLGHVDIARRASLLCDRLIVAVMRNSAKKSVFSIDERVDMAKICLSSLPTVEVIAFDRLLVELYRETNASAVVRGLRSESDFRNEAEMAAANRFLCKEYEVILLPCRIDLAYTSSSIVREVAYYGGDISGMVDPLIADRVMKRLRERKAES